MTPPRIATRPFVMLAAAAALAFGLAYSFLPLAAPARLNSPDETSNRFFAEHFAKTGNLYYFEPLNIVVDGLVHPRSVRVVDGFLVPGGFIGLPVIYGSVAKALGTAAIPYLTPFFAVLGVLGWGLLVRAMFGGKIGLLAAALLFADPAWWYASSRTLQPNVLFVALLILSACAFVAGPFRRYGNGVIAGVLFAFALSARMSEAYWLAPAALALVIALRGRLPWGRVALSAVAAAAALAPFLLLNQSLYGGILATGYGDDPSSLPMAASGGLGARLIGPLGPILFPLGFAPRTAASHFMTYGVGFFWWWSLLVAAGLAVACRAAWAKRKAAARDDGRRNARAFAAFAAVATVWLILFYGSWTIRDNPDPSAVTIGSSYLRYWLPIFVLSTVPVAWAAAKAAAALPDRYSKPVLAAAFAVYAAVSAAAVFGAPEEGILALRRTMIRDDERARVVFERTPERSLIVVDRADKLLFPERPVMRPLRDDATFAALPKLGRFAALYYYGISFPEADLAYLREVKLPPLGFGIEPVVSFGDESLYLFTPREGAPKNE